MWGIKLVYLGELIMLTIYEKALKILNPKLYQSEYHANINEVVEVLSHYKFRYRITFFKNFRTLKIETSSLDELAQVDEAAVAYYDRDKNIIVLSSQNGMESVNHELFHSASNKKHFFENCFLQELKEGITEYLANKSKKKKKSKNYELELFVIEVLVFIYGEKKIIGPYLLNDQNKWYRIFSKRGYLIVLELERLLSSNTSIKIINKNRINYLVVSEMLDGLISDEEEFLEQLRLDYDTPKLIKKMYSKLTEEQLEKMNFPINKFIKIDFKNYNYQKYYKGVFYQRWNNEYIERLKSIFKEILTNLIELLYEKNISDEEIEQMFMEIFNKKSDEFKEIYWDSLFEVIGFKNKRRK